MRTNANGWSNHHGRGARFDLLDALHRRSRWAGVLLPQGSAPPLTRQAPSRPRSGPARARRVTWPSDAKGADPQTACPARTDGAGTGSHLRHRPDSCRLPGPLSIGGRPVGGRFCGPPRILCIGEMEEAQRVMVPTRHARTNQLRPAYEARHMWADSAKQLACVPIESAGRTISRRTPAARQVSAYVPGFAWRLPHQQGGNHRTSSLGDP
jgi:hypothetical protein